MTHVPYRGSNPALTDLMGGQVPGAVRQHAVVDRADQRRQDPRARRDHREARRYFPDLPTFDETVPGYEASAWFGMGVKAGTPPDIIAYLNKQIEEALADRRSSSALPISAVPRWAARRKTLARSSRQRPRSGRRWSSIPAPAWSRGYLGLIPFVRSSA
jgi:tripartite-type tricarboxylate transporter receptor subunit TctC